MPAYAYRMPLTDKWRAEFEELDLRGTKQVRVPCKKNCGVEYVLIHPTDADDERIAQYVGEVHRYMQLCGNHNHERMLMNF